LFSALLVFRLLPRGFSNRDLRDHWVLLLGQSAQTMTQGQMSYHLRCLRLHGLIERLPKSHRYRVTDRGWRSALFYTRTYNRLLRPGLAQVVPPEVETETPLRRSFERLDEAIEVFLEQQKVPA
jgi:hypothetical protein